MKYVFGTLTKILDLRSYILTSLLLLSEVLAVEVAYRDAMGGGGSVALCLRITRRGGPFGPKQQHFPGLGHVLRNHQSL